MNQISGREIGRKIGEALGLSDEDLADVVEITLTAGIDGLAELTLKVRLRADLDAEIEKVIDELRAYRLVPRNPDSSDNT